MKRLLWIIVMAAGCNAKTEHHDHEEVRVIVEPKWQNLEPNHAHACQFGGKWMLAGSITFKKKTKDTLYLTELDLHWNGKPLDNLVGSLYDKPLDKEFMAIEDALICDGTWNKTTQTLLLKFDKKRTLNAVTIFYLVLTVPEHLESTLKHGSFDIHATSIPEPLILDTHDFRLSLDVLD